MLLHPAAVFLTLVLGSLPAQAPCYDFGSVPMAARIDQGPPLAGCPVAAAQPSFQLYTPAHRAPALRRGFNPGNATERPRWLLTYRCTGLWLVPAVPHQLRRSGYVVDQPEFRCDDAR